MQNYQNLSVDLSNCDSEPIHIIGRIQPHGVLLILNRQSYVIEQVSQNINLFLDANPQDLIGKKLQAIISASEYEAFQLQLLRNDSQQVHLMELQGKKFFGFMHISEGSLVIECEPFERSSSDESRLALNIAYSSFQKELVKASTTIEEQADNVVQLVQHLLDYDRVMLYRFDENWNGEVIAERIKPGAHSYLYHHFPASDIPAQARALLEIKPVRQIADVTAQAVNITPYLNPGTGRPSNIIQSELRNPSEIHLEYLRNMDVLATLSISVIVKGKLWGIIACQHNTPLFINYWKRQVCLNIAQAFANAVIASQEQRDVQLLELNRRKEEQLLAQVLQAGSIGEGLFKKQLNLLELTFATGAALFLDGELYTIGETPTQTELYGLQNWISETITDRFFHTRELSVHYPEAAAFKEVASGLLVLEISKFRKEYILYFKPEIQETRIWAGNPDKSYRISEDKQRLHPRKSFENWAELVKGKSHPWNLNELEVTQNLLKDVVSVILLHQAKALEKLNRELNKTSQALDAKNKRLEEFTHIISHNLRSPLSNMQGLYNMYSAEPDEATAVEVMQMMEATIKNMSATIDDVNLILKSEFEEKLERQHVDLDELVKKELQNLQSVIIETHATINTNLEVNSVYAPKVYLESVLHNLLSNALKYRSPERTPVVDIKSWKDGNTLCLTVTDNGLGMNMDKVGNRLFSMYATFHKNKDAKGLGLYLTKSQIEALGGTVTVESTLGEGTSFHVCIPIVK